MRTMVLESIYRNLVFKDSGKQNFEKTIYYEFMLSSPVSQKSVNDHILYHLVLQQENQDELDEQTVLSLWDAALLVSFCSHIEPV